MCFERPLCFKFIINPLKSSCTADSESSSGSEQGPRQSLSDWYQDEVCEQRTSLTGWYLDGQELPTAESCLTGRYRLSASVPQGAVGLFWRAIDVRHPFGSDFLDSGSHERPGSGLTNH